MLLAKANGKVRVCLDQARLNKVLTRPVPRGSTLNDILLRLAGMKYISLIDESSDYHILQLDKKIQHI